MFLCRQLTD